MTRGRALSESAVGGASHPGNQKGSWHVSLIPNPLVSQLLGSQTDRQIDPLRPNIQVGRYLLLCLVIDLRLVPAAISVHIFLFPQANFYPICMSPESSAAEQCIWI